MFRYVYICKHITQTVDAACHVPSRQYFSKWHLVHKDALVTSLGLGMASQLHKHWY